MEKCNLIFWILDFVLAVVLLQLLIRFPFLDVPESRSAHRVPTPTSAGLVFLVCYTSLLLALGHLKNICPAILTSCAIVLGVVGFWDDRKNVSFRIRLLVQLGMAAVCLSLLAILCPTAHVMPHWLYYIALLILWGGFMNAINFSDGLNGLLGTGSLIASVFCGLYFPENKFLFWAMVPVLGAFLLFNLRGKIFMGDAGSLFIGFLFPGLLLLQHQPLSVGIMLLGHLFFPFLLDVSLTVAHRLCQRKSVVEPHRDFYLHQLNQLGLSHGTVTLIYGHLVVIQGATAVLAFPLSVDSLLILYGADAVLYSIIVGFFYIFKKTVKHSKSIS